MDYKQEVADIIEALKEAGSEENIRGMARFGIDSSRALGVKTPVLKEIAKHYKKQHELAFHLWKTEIHECRLLAGLIVDPKLLKAEDAELWLKDVDSWDICDNLGMKVYPLTSFCWEKVVEWSEREGEFEKRMAFATIVGMVIRLKKTEDEDFLPLFELIKKASDDERNFVWKAVNWALRTLGKRSLYLNEIALNVSEEILAYQTKAGNKIARDAIRELKSIAVQDRLRKKQG